MKKYDIETKKFSELKGKIEIPKFQRGLVWGDEKRKSFIKTLKDGLPIGVLLLSEKENGKYLVIDGLQRFSTMCDYSADVFSYLDRSEITDKDIISIIMSSKSASDVFYKHQESAQNTIKENIRDILVNNIRKGQGINDFKLSVQISKDLCSGIAELPKEDSGEISAAVYSIIDAFRKSSSIDDIEIPLIVFKGNESELAQIFQKLNQEGVKLSKYDVFAATWINHTVTVKNDPSFINFIINKYDDAQEKSSLDIANYDPDEIKKTGVLTVFEYAFALGKAMQDHFPPLFGESKDDSKIDSMGFLILAELFGLSYNQMGNLAIECDKYKKVIDFKELKDAIIESCNIVCSALKPFIIAPTAKNTSLACHSDLQLASYIIVVFKLKYSLSISNGLVEQKTNKGFELRQLKCFLWKHYIWDIIRDYWAGSGDTKLEGIIENPKTCRYIFDVDKNSFEQSLNEWLAESISATNQSSIKAQAKLFLNYLLRLSVPSYKIEKTDYDIEHCVPKKIIQAFFLNNKIAVPMSSVCNLVYIPKSDNRGKGELTYYQRRKKHPSAFTIDDAMLNDLCYPSESELSFVESHETITKNNYLTFLKNRAFFLARTFIDKIYKQD